MDPEIGRLLDALRPYEESLPYDSDEASIIRVARRDYERLVKVPPAFMAEFTEHSSRGYMTWAEARPANDFRKVQPMLEKTLDYSRKLADFFPGYEHIADPLIDFADYGMKASIGPRAVRRAARKDGADRQRPSPPSRPRTTPACASIIPKPSSSLSARKWSSSSATTSTAGASTRPTIPS